MKNIKWIDVFKGIGIIAVVVGHIWDGLISRMIYVFHMPLFFFISGYLSKPVMDYRAFFTKKVKSLIIPYIVYLSLLYMAFHGFPELTLKRIAINIARPIIGGRFLGGTLGVFWFVTCLFLTQQIMNYLLVKFERKTVLCIMIFFLVLSYINALVFPEFWLPWDANVVLASAPIYYIGYTFKKKVFKLNNIIIFIGIILVCGFTYLYPNNFYDMKKAIYGYPFITFISSILLILGVKIAAEYLAEREIFEKPIAELGKASMVIMYLHQPIQYVVKNNFSEDGLIRIIAAITISYLAYLLFTKNKYTNALLLGNFKQFDMTEVLKLKRVKKHCEDSTILKSK